MNERIFPVVIFFIAFLVSLYAGASIPPVWRSDGWMMGIVGFGVLTSLSALLLAYWFYSDYKENQQNFEFLQEKLRKIEAYLETKKPEEQEHTFFDETSRALFKKEKES